MLAVCSSPVSSYGSAISLVEGADEILGGLFSHDGTPQCSIYRHVKFRNRERNPTSPASLLELKANRSFQSLAKVTHFAVTLNGEVRKLPSLPVVAGTEDHWIGEL
jgi:hypothetical protein